MKTLLAILVVLVVALALFWSGTTTGILPDGIPKGIPVAELDPASPHPEIGLIAPLPSWIPLPDSGNVISAGVYPPQPPYGAAAVVMVSTDLSSKDFAAGYGRRLDGAGFAMRQIPNPPNLVIDAPELSFEADERKGGRVVYVTMRNGFGVRVAQLTFWDVPAPHL